MIPKTTNPTDAQQAAIVAVTTLYGAQVADLEALHLAWLQGDITGIDTYTASTAARWTQLVSAFGALHDLYPGRMAPTAIIAPIVADFYAKLGTTPDLGELDDSAGRAA